MLTAEKVCHCLALARMMRVPFLLVMQFTDGTYWADLSKEEIPEFGFSGRTDRDDMRDQQLMAFIPMSWFKKIELQQAA